MGKITIFDKLFDKMKGDKIEYNLNFVPRQAIPIFIEGKKYFVSVICDDEYKVSVVILDSNQIIVKKLMDVKVLSAYLGKIDDKLYVFNGDKAYIYDINNIKERPKERPIGDINIGSIASSENYIFVYSTELNKIFKFDRDLNPVAVFDNRFSTKDMHLGVQLTSNNDNFFSLPTGFTSEEFYMIRKSFLTKYFSRKIAETNLYIDHVAFNEKENTLYIGMSHIIIVVKDGKEYGYIPFKTGLANMTYDNNLNEMILCYASTDKHGHLLGKINEISNEELNKMIIPLEELTKDLQGGTVNTFMQYLDPGIGPK